MRPKAQRRRHPRSQTDVGQCARMAVLHGEECPEPTAQEGETDQQCADPVVHCSRKRRRKYYIDRNPLAVAVDNEPARFSDTWNEGSGPSRLHANFLHWPSLDAEDPVAGFEIQGDAYFSRQSDPPAAGHSRLAHFCLPRHNSKRVYGGQKAESREMSLVASRDGFGCAN